MRRRPLTKKEARKLRRTVRPTTERDRMLQMAGRVAAGVLSSPDATRGVGLLLETLGRSMQEAAEHAEKRADDEHGDGAPVVYVSRFDGVRKREGGSGG